MPAEVTSPVVSAVADQLGVDTSVVEGVLGDIPAAELAEKSVAHLVWVVGGQMTAAQKRLSGEPVVVIDTDLPAESVDDAVLHAGINRLTPGAVIRVVTDDMPFIVDSLVAAFTARGAGIGDVIHPQMAAVREADGRLKSVSRDRSRQGAIRLPGHQDQLPSGTERVSESWVYLHVSPVGDFAGPQEIAEVVRSVLGDVRLAVRDWPAMRDAALATAAELDANPPATVPEFAIVDVKRFLTWLADGNFTFVGYREYVLEEVDGEDVLRPESGTELGILRNAPSTPRGSSG